MLLFFNQSLSLVLPFLVVTLALVIVDLVFGVEAARRRYKETSNPDDRVRASRAIHRTIGKVMEYLCWLVLASTLAVAFHKEWIHYVIMAVIIVNELISIIDNYFYVHGKKVTGLWRFVLKAVGKKFELDTSDIDIRPLDEEDNRDDNTFDGRNEHHDKRR